MLGPGAVDEDNEGPMTKDMAYDGMGVAQELLRVRQKQYDRIACLGLIKWSALKMKSSWDSVTAGEVRKEWRNCCLYDFHRPRGGLSLMMTALVVALE